MEHREPPRTGPSDEPPRASILDFRLGRRLPRLDAPAPARTSRLPRRYRVAVVATLAVVVVSLLAVEGWRRSYAYLRVQPEYQMTFAEITLDPEPPEWYRGGKDAFLERVRREAHRQGPFSTLDPMILPTLEKLFKRDAVVKGVTLLRIENPKKVAIRLEYRRPVARTQPRKSAAVSVIDEEGVLLPTEVIRPEFLEGADLIRLSPESFGPPGETKPGEPWMRLDSTGRYEPDPDVADAARFAATLQTLSGRDRKNPASAGRPLTIHDHPKHGSWWVQYGDRWMFRWGVRDAKSPSDEARWTMMREWLAAHEESDLGQLPRFYLVLTPKGVEVTPNPPPRKPPG